MRNRRVRRGVVWGVTLGAVLLLVGGGAFAAGKNCTRVGTWFGVGDSGTTWINVVSPGPNATVGQVNLDFVLLDPTLGGFFPTAVRTTSGAGVWQKSNKSNVQYTWMAYGLDATGALVYTARASGTASATDCDHWAITYVLEIWQAGLTVGTDPPTFCAPGTATEARMPLVQASCPQ